MLCFLYINVKLVRFLLEHKVPRFKKFVREHEDKFAEWHMTEKSEKDLESIWKKRFEKEGARLKRIVKVRTFYFGQ